MRRSKQMLLALGLGVVVAGGGVGLVEGTRSSSTAAPATASKTAAVPVGSATVNVTTTKVDGQSEQILVNARMPGLISDSPLAHDLIRIGDEAIATEDDAKLQAYFTDDHVFHGPGGDLSFDELRAYFASLRVALSELRIVREQIIVDGNYLAARTTFSGDFTGVFTHSPIGPVEPTGQHLQWEVIGTFRYQDDGRLAEEWVQTDYRSFLTKLGVTVAESL